MDAISEEECCIHIADIANENLIAITTRRLEKLNECLPEWSKTSKEPESSVAKKAIDNNAVALGNLHHHSCYTRLVNVRKLHEAVNRISKISVQEVTDCDEPPKKLLRSASTLKLPQQTMPDVCIICRTSTKFKTTSSKKRVRDPLLQAQTLTAGRLLEAAQRKNDEQVLVHIRGTDCVALEVKYHRSCYNQYTRFLYSKESGNVEKRVERFLDKVVEEEIIAKKQCFRMTDLLQKVVNEGSSLSAVYQLKYYLKDKYPQLIYHKPQNQRFSEIVSCDAITIADLVPDDTIICTQQSKPSTTTDDDDDDEFDGSSTFLDHAALTERSELYHTGLKIAKQLDENNIELHWPPSSSEITLKQAMDMVPSELYNLISLVTKCSTEVPADRGYLHLTSTDHLKVLSICQDIVLLHSKGKKQTPKSVALGMTIRHMTGSSHINRILHGFGHSTSYDSIHRLETAMATMQLNHIENNNLPTGFKLRRMTTLVFDNIDFVEETLSGAGSTHNTNGIMFQQPGVAGEEQISAPVHTVSKRQKAFSSTEPNIPPYHHKHRQGPQMLTDIDHYMQPGIYSSCSENIDKAFVCCKYVAAKDIPGWTGFNQIVSNTELDKSLLHYLPMVEAPATDISTVNYLLQYAANMAEQLQLPAVVVVFDQALYAKAQQIRWQRPDLEEKLVVRMGEFHTVMAFLATIGKRFAKSGLEDLLIESEVVASGSLNGVMSGHKYNRSLRAHKLLFEAMSRILLDTYARTLPDAEREKFMDSLRKINIDFADLQTVDSDYVGVVLKDFDQYVKLKCVENPTFSLWSSYIEMMRILLTFIRGTRESNWKLHLESLRLMLPYFHAYDRTNYARYATTYWLEMEALKHSHPWVHSELNVKGSWTVQRTDGGTFGSVSADQTIEQTINRDSKTSGGIRGITLTRGAVQRWILSHPEKAAMSSSCDRLAGLTKSSRSHKDIDRTRIAKDCEAVSNLMSTVKSLFHPFADSDKLINIASGHVASEETTTDMMAAREIGETKLQDFIQSRFVNKSIDLFAPLKANKLKTCDTSKSTKKPLSKQQSNTKVMKQDRTLFARLLVASRDRHVDMKSLLTYSLSPVPLSLSLLDGSLCKTNKAAIMPIIEADVAYIDETTILSSALILDAMALIRSVPQSTLPDSFGGLAKRIIEIIHRMTKTYHAKRVDFVIDRYLDRSIKNVERNRRANSEVEMLITSSSQRLPKQWTKFLSNSNNKTQLLNFLAQEFKSNQLDDGVIFVVTCDQTCFSILDGTVTNLHHLDADHEEADTRLLLHALDARSYDTVIINSSDTDVAVISMYMAYKHTLDNLLILTGVGKRKRLVNISSIAKKHADLAPHILSMHAFSGCDTVSSFSGKGKRTVVNKLRSFPPAHEFFSKLGENFDITDNLLSLAEMVVCALYGVDGTSVDEARYRIFCTHNSAETSMPPTKDALKYHLKRANYQATIWKRSDRAAIQAPPPEGHGWVVDGDQLQIFWTEKDVAPQELLQIASCKCSSSSSRCAGRCTCRTSNLPCTDLCLCENCENTELVHTSQLIEDDESDSEEEI